MDRKAGQGRPPSLSIWLLHYKVKRRAVALVDGNLQFGDVAVFMNEQVRNSILDLAPRADELDAEVVNNVMLTHPASGIKLLAAPNSS